MVYIDETGAQIESYDLTKGYLEDAEWIDHPAVKQAGHYEYGKNDVQRYVIDTPARAARREVTVRRFVRYTDEELAQRNAPTVEDRIAALEDAIISQ